MSRNWHTRSISLILDITVSKRLICACFLDLMEETKRCGLRRQAQVQGKNKNASNRKQASKENETPPPKWPEETSAQKRIRHRVTSHAQQNLLRRNRSRHFCPQKVSKTQYHQNLARLFIVIGRTLCCVLKRWVLDWPTVTPNWRRPPPSENGRTHVVKTWS